MHLTSKVAARHLASFFGEGEQILFGKYKNKVGIIRRLYLDERGVPVVEIEPVPKGRKKNKVMGLFNIWKRPEVRQEMLEAQNQGSRGATNDKTSS